MKRSLICFDEFNEIYGNSKIGTKLRLKKFGDNIFKQKHESKELLNQIFINIIFIFLFIVFLVFHRL